MGAHNNNDEQRTQHAQRTPAAKEGRPAGSTTPQAAQRTASPTAPPSTPPATQPAGNHAADVVRVRKKIKHRKIPRWVRIIIVAIAALLVIAAVAFAVNYFIGQANLRGAEPGEGAMEHAEAVQTSGGKTIEYDGHTYAYNENIVSIAIMGFDRSTVEGYEAGREGQADSLMVAAIDTETGNIDIVAIPRDTMAEVDTYSDTGDYLATQTKQICLAYSYGDGKQTSCENTVKSISRVMYGMPINYYLALDESGIGALNDAIGGVALTALETIPKTNITEGEDVLLMGNNAYRYVQYRDTTILDSALGRQARQVQYVQAFAQKALSLVRGEVGTLVNLFGLAQNYSVMNLGTAEFTYLATSVATNGISSVNMTTLPGEMVQGDYYAEYNLDKDDVYKVVLDTYYTQID